LSARRHLGVWIGLEAVAALAALAVALALGRKLDRAGLIALGAWLVAGIVLCSAMADLRPRYLELVDPAVAGVLGIGAAVLARRRPPAAYLVGGALACVLAVPFATSIAAVRSGTQDSGTVGALPAARLAALTAFLDRHPGELAATAPGAVASLIAGQSRPVLLLGDGLGRQLVTPRALAHSGARYALLGRCAGGESGCLPVDLWARAHGRPLRVGGGLLYALTPGRAAADRGRTPTLARSRRAASHRGAAALAVAVPGIGARRHGRH
jgi:hypothetical protein